MNKNIIIIILTIIVVVSNVTWLVSKKPNLDKEIIKTSSISVVPTQTNVSPPPLLTAPPMTPILIPQQEASYTKFYKTYFGVDKLSIPYPANWIATDYKGNLWYDDKKSSDAFSVRIFDPGTLSYNTDLEGKPYLYESQRINDYVIIDYISSKYSPKEYLDRIYGGGPQSMTTRKTYLINNMEVEGYILHGEGETNTWTLLYGKKEGSYYNLVNIQTSAKDPGENTTVGNIIKNIQITK